MTTPVQAIYLDPSYPDYYQDRLFDTSDPVLNRDGTLVPFARLRKEMLRRGIQVQTADFLLSERGDSRTSHYYSLGLLENYPKLIGRPNVRLRGFLLMEPPVVAPKLYRALPEITKYFDQVFLHNPDGDGYSLEGVDRSKLRKLYWPQPFDKVIPQYWDRVERLNRIVVINGNHIPRSFKSQLYGARIEAMAELAKFGSVDLYGRGWDRWWSHRSMWPPYWLNIKALLSIYRGPCESKYEVLSRYRYSLCFENMSMRGYVTEKLFDCLYAGCVPIYMGAQNIADLIPSDSYIDYRHFASWGQLNNYLVSMSERDVARLRDAGRAFIEGASHRRYFDSLVNLVCDADIA